MPSYRDHSFQYLSPQRPSAEEAGESQEVAGVGLTSWVAETKVVEVEVVAALVDTLNFDYTDYLNNTLKVVSVVGLVVVEGEGEGEVGMKIPVAGVVAVVHMSMVGDNVAEHHHQYYYNHPSFESKGLAFVVVVVAAVEVAAVAVKGFGLEEVVAGMTIAVVVGMACKRPY